MAELLSRERCLQLSQYMIDGAAPGSIAALWINLDRFQQVNETFGYGDGDKIIAIIARRLDEAVGHDAHIGHMGADEFVCLLYAENESVVTELAVRIETCIKAALTWDDMTLHPSASIGIAMLQAGENAISLLQRADQAMHRAKRGSQRWLYAHADDTERRPTALPARTELDIESKLHRAMDTGGLELHYQPILGLDGSIESVEALMRCTVDGKSLPPGIFIPVAEKTGLITRLGEWTLTQGALFARRLMEAGYDFKVAVNVSRAQLLSPAFAQTLSSAMIYAKVPANRLELELTESLFMDMSSTVQENLCDVRATGVTLAIDDFGTGYSCLANLKDIHAAKLKLDRAFATALPDDPRAYAIVKAMTRLGQELGMVVVAEGVENEAQMQALRQARINGMQGHLYASAMSGDTLLEWLRTRTQDKTRTEYDHDSIRQ
ncbi:MAG TPA: bifunctional diguanylate cyclase/phosphodiesterase [Rhodocyclaceae bacterium]|jgi:diguanylate cyclase (GGDEF)-like protein|nr:bifunctional diguanylate cyclase/phosphodiesterase [Rhodocyclaceae bacterium]